LLLGEEAAVPVAVVEFVVLALVKEGSSMDMTRAGGTWSALGGGDGGKDAKDLPLAAICVEGTFTFIAGDALLTK